LTNRLLGSGEASLQDENILSIDRIKAACIMYANEHVEDLHDKDKDVDVKAMIETRTPKKKSKSTIYNIVN